MEAIETNMQMVVLLELEGNGGDHGFIFAKKYECAD
jgi:hypothetical protein